MVEAILLFIYQLDPYSTPIEVSPTLFSVMLYVANDKYMIPKLKVLAKETTATLLRGTKVHEDFPSVISEFYHTTREDDRALRDLILLTSHRHLDALKLNKNFQKVLRETRDFASDLVLLQRGYGLDSFSCKSGYCKAVWWLMPGASSSYRYCPHCRSSIAKS
ncbi:BTB/POZ protein [Penicillium cataractarum]|uniref:BTB/POZ protein n=1 Tax=Penicillium cataractarum TaxID=2100454 RepID=A0A9W9RQI5_9EURO|nr:BTB/POZ protein [Penicillium cataractarum]KAJ5364427.1 BTB/POZ protein [Penicillium cataractarum]